MHCISCSGPVANFWHYEADIVDPAANEQRECAMYSYRFISSVSTRPCPTPNVSRPGQLLVASDARGWNRREAARSLTGLAGAQFRLLSRA